MTSPFHLRLIRELDTRRNQNLWRTLRLPGPHRWNLAHNDYLQLRRHPDVIRAAQEAAAMFGAGSGASPLLTGYQPCHDKLLNRLKVWKQKREGLLFNTGFMANQALLKHLPGPRDLVLADRLIHHSMTQALASRGTRFRRYRHLDLGHLEELLRRHGQSHETMFVVTESVYSMDGDYPDLTGIAALKQQHPFIWILDEAHGVGVFGPTGGGLAEEMGVLDQVDVVMGTLGKALASMGAYVLTDSREVIDYLVNLAGEFIYSTFLPPGCAGAALEAVEQIVAMPGARRHLRATSRWFRLALRESGWETTGEDSQIVPLLMGAADKALDLQRHLQDQGILVGAVRPPTVPDGSSRLRFSLNTALQRETLQEILDSLDTWRKQ